MNDTTFPAPVLTSKPSSSIYTLASKHPHAFYRLCLAVLCERWAAFMLISTAALMLCERYGLPPAVSLRWLGIASAAYYVGSLPGGYLLDQNHQPVEESASGASSSCSVTSLCLFRIKLRCMSRLHCWSLAIPFTSPAPSASWHRCTRREIASSKEPKFCFTSWSTSGQSEALCSQDRSQSTQDGTSPMAAQRS
jgi:hypothetical protein